MVKVIVQMYPVLRAESTEEREELRPIGRNKERFQEAMDGMPDLLRAMDDLDVWGVSSIEHHFHSECPRPGDSTVQPFVPRVRNP